MCTPFQFGQVFRVVPAIGTFAMKISRSDHRLRQQALHEASILERLLIPPDPESIRVSTLLTHFLFRGHICIVLELLSFDLYCVLRRRDFFGIPLPLLQTVARDLFEALVLFSRRGVIHGDLKPENVVLCDGVSTHVKMIDFGAARTLDQRCPTYVQSRYYRAPEVVLRIVHGPAIDIWSLGCVLCELFISAPLFAGQSEVQLLDIIAGFLGPPPLPLAQASPRFLELFAADGTLKGEELVCRDKGVPPQTRHHYLLTESSLSDLIVEYEAGRGRNAAERKIQRRQRLLLVDLLAKMIVWEPAKRITADQAMLHPFITTELSG
jgi:dual specificity protein kinase YAK1